ncbi:RNA polymerase I-specific transcription initiation factor-domain-containing protein [Astrocystis sublimbata]|nr:RNA polymerase I-specific transcription initiation factor-domain-containing protein [Astrocystis sublimbata]
MAHAGSDSDEYIPASDDSDAADERPNRWKGPPSTWQQLNSAEIDTITALDDLRNQDLSVHLYNAFSLKHRHGKITKRKDVKSVSKQGVAAAGIESKWIPPNAWTAWPLPASVVPRPEFMKRAGAADEHITFKMETAYAPQAELEQTISATMLRLAKEKFQARKAESEPRPGAGDEDGSAVELSSASSNSRLRSRARSRPKSRALKYESTSEGEMMDLDDPHGEERPISATTPNIPLEPVVATDDELSYKLLRPSVQSVIKSLDIALRVLHNAQESKMHYHSESEASDASSRSRSRTRTRSRSRRLSSNLTVSPDDMQRNFVERRSQPRATGSIAPKNSEGVKKKLGRPKKEYPRLEGEAEGDYMIRIARLRKKSIPHFDDDHTNPASGSAPKLTAAEVAPSKPKGSLKSRPQSRPRQREPTAESDTTSENEPQEKSFRRPRLALVRLRDWKDVIGAAALAGIPAEALDRTARRCANLFGQSFVMHTLQEDPSAPNNPTEYKPGLAMTSLPRQAQGSDDDDVDTDTHNQVPVSQPPQPCARGRPLKSNTGSSSMKTGYFCIVSNCPRAVKPFTRRANLLHHLKVIHQNDGDVGLPLTEVPSEDEMHGAVHVDGFLKPIKIRPGWGRDDATQEKRKPRIKLKTTADAVPATRSEDTDTSMREANDNDSSDG